MALRNKDSAMNKMSRCRTRNLAPVHSRRGRECDCELRKNMILMRPWAEFCDLPIEGTRGVLRIHPWCLKGFFLGERKEEREERERERGAWPWMEKREKPCPGWRRHERRALVGTDGKRALEKREKPCPGWRKGLSPRLEWKDDERQGR
ncbi:hypothetical protein TNCV_1105091 [Trichonephila clavipes]|nr:hypothetical protein TNCV_1105091 [Trichonephila clavipes]